jgi:hypothetical protein
MLEAKLLKYRSLGTIRRYIDDEAKDQLHVKLAKLSNLSPKRREKNQKLSDKKNLSILVRVGPDISWYGYILAETKGGREFFLKIQDGRIIEALTPQEAKELMGDEGEAASPPAKPSR